jgi:enamine deaminase RidA (YjgF/YER057c/UK114 family)
VYKPFLIVGNLAYVSGHGPLLPDKSLITGRVGDTINIDDAKLAAQQVGLAILATLKKNLGSLNNVKRVVKVLGSWWQARLILKSILMLSTDAVNCSQKFGVMIMA